MRIFELSGNMVRVLLRPSGNAPRAGRAPMQESPNQSVTALPVEREHTDYRRAGPVLDLMRRLRDRPAVKLVPIRQRGYILRAPHAPIGQATIEIPDQRLGILTYPADLARRTYDYGAMDAPARLQSVPGYTVISQQTTRQSAGYPASAMKAPKPRYGGGQCE